MVYILVSRKSHIGLLIIFNVFVIQNEELGDISSNRSMPLTFMLGSGKINMRGNIGLNLFDLSVIEIDQLEQVKKILIQINVVLKTKRLRQFLCSGLQSRDERQRHSQRRGGHLPVHGYGGDAVLFVIKNRHRDASDAQHKFFIVYADIAHIDAFQLRIQLIYVGERVWG